MSVQEVATNTARERNKSCHQTTRGGRGRSGGRGRDGNRNRYAGRTRNRDNQDQGKNARARYGQPAAAAPVPYQGYYAPRPTGYAAPPAYYQAQRAPAYGGRGTYVPSSPRGGGRGGRGYAGRRGGCVGAYHAQTYAAQPDPAVEPASYHYDTHGVPVSFDETEQEVHFMDEQFGPEEVYYEDDGDYEY